MNNKKTSIGVKIMMFVSSYFPLYIVVIILYASKIQKALLEKDILGICFLLIITFLIIISIMSVILLRKGTGYRKRSIKNVENPDDTVLSYIMTYIIPLVTNGDNSCEVYIVNILLFILIGYIYLRLNLIYLNPLWSICGYLIYKDDNGIIITNISKEGLKHMNDIKGYYISNDVFVAHKKNNTNQR